MVTYDDEPALLQASRRGDTEAFASLVHRYQKMVHSLTYRMCGSEADAADLAQLTFLQAWRKLEAFRGDSKFSTWLGRIAINTCLNWQDGAVREARARAAWGEERLNDPSPAVEDGPVQLVQQSLLRLSPKQRAALVLTVCEGMSHAEAARLLQCSEATVSWRVFVARKKLRHWLGPLQRERE